MLKAMSMYKNKKPLLIARPARACHLHNEGDQLYFSEMLPNNK